MRASTALALLALLTPGIVLANAVEIYDPGEATVSNPAPLLPPLVVTDVLWDNGPLVNCPGCGVPLDVSTHAPFTNIVCPECGAETRVKCEFGP